MVSLGVVRGHWWLQRQGKWQYLQHTCASFFLHVLSFKHSFTTENIKKTSSVNETQDLPPSLGNMLKSVSKVSCFKSNIGVTEYKLLFHKHKDFEYWYILSSSFLFKSVYGCQLSQ